VEILPHWVNSHGVNREVAFERVLREHWLTRKIPVAV
jgi:hypothetical protein